MNDQNMVLCCKCMYLLAQNHNNTTREHMENVHLLHAATSSIQIKHDVQIKQ